MGEHEKKWMAREAMVTKAANREIWQSRSVPKALGWKNRFLIYASESRDCENPFEKV